jgi:Ni/Fe-hydrogenase subunit HybB-like protein
MTIVESNLSARAFGRELEADILAGIGRAASVALAIYLLVKVADLIARGAVGALGISSFHTTMYLIEIGIGVIAPMLILATRRGRQNSRVVFLSGGLIVAGVLLNRLNTALLGWWVYAGSGPVYVPSLSEITISVSLVTLGVVAFGLIAKFFPVFSHEKHAHA